MTTSPLETLHRAATQPRRHRLTVDQLLVLLQARTVDQGYLPSRNQIMSDFNVGAKKANAVLARLERTEGNPTDRLPTYRGRQLHAVATPGSEPGQSHAQEPSGGIDGAADDDSSVGVVEDEDRTPARVTPLSVRSWRLTLLLLSLPAFVAIWGGWVGLGTLTGFGPMHLLPGIADRVVINSAITLPIGVETYAAFALWIWLGASGCTRRARDFARLSAFAALGLGMVGQVAYHLMSAAGVTRAPWPVTTLVACLPVVVLGCGAALAHLLHTDGEPER